MKVSKLFLNSIINYKQAASTDGIRKDLNAVAIRLVNKELEITATDGLKSIRSKWPVEGSEEMLEDTYYLIETSSIQIIKDYLKRRELKNINTFTMKIDHESMLLKISINDLMRDQDAITISLLDRDYPKIDNLYNPHADDEKASSVILNLDDLTLLRKSAFGTGKQRLPKINFNFSSKDRVPISATCNCDGILHDIMIAVCID